jgi:uncharacterized protein
LILLDTSGLLSLFVAAETSHELVAQAFEQEQPPFLISPFVLAELDYLVASRGGATAELAGLRELCSGAYDLVALDAADLAQAADVIERFRDLSIGLTDASIVVLAGRFGTERVLTLDERHFRALRTPSGGTFTLLPADD